MIARMKRNRAGFTLVELIIVIAILAILTGVAVPVYSGYIKKANEASDLQLLGAMNTAFSAACAERGVNPTNLVATAALSGEQGNMTVTGVSAVRRGGAALSAGEPAFDSAALNEAFLRYFGENTDKPFKVYTSLGYDSVNGVFVDGAKELTFVTPNGTVTVTAAQLGAYRGSSFDQMGAAGITGKIDNLVNQAMGAISESDVAFLGSEEFTSFLTEKGITLDPSDPDYSTKAANALVLYTASHAEGTDVQAWVDALQNGEPLAIQGMSGASMILPVSAEYAMLVAYCSDSNAKLSHTTTTTVGEETIILNKNSDIDWQSSCFTDGKYDSEKAAEWVKNTYGENAILNGGSKFGLNITIPGMTVTETTVMNANEWFEEQTANMSENGIFSITGLHGVTNSVTGEPIEIAGMWETFSQCDEFQNYVQNQAGSDLTAFISALEMVDANTSNVDLNSVLTNGWQNGGVADIIAAVTGNP